jgi:hypothetical protein
MFSTSRVQEVAMDEREVRSVAATLAGNSPRLAQNKLKSPVGVAARLAASTNDPKVMGQVTIVFCSMPLPSKHGKHPGKYWPCGQQASVLVIVEQMVVVTVLEMTVVVLSVIVAVITEVTKSVATMVSIDVVWSVDTVVVLDVEVVVVPVTVNATGNWQMAMKSFVKGQTSGSDATNAAACIQLHPKAGNVEFSE